MKQLVVSIILLFFIFNSLAQDYFISFSASGATNLLEKVEVLNLNTGLKKTLAGSDTLHLITEIRNSLLQKSYKSNSVIEMPYNIGDRLKFTGKSGDYQTIIMNTPHQNKILTFNFVECIDGSSLSYPVVQIGTQTWMAENLRAKKFNDHIDILSRNNMSYYFSTYYKPAFCIYNNSLYYYNRYGALYDWELVWTEKLCPIGWHVPSLDEWVELMDYLGGYEIAGGKLKQTGTEHWKYPNGNASDYVGFGGLPGGANFNEEKGYEQVWESGFWWSSTVFEMNKTKVYYMLLRYEDGEIRFGANQRNTSSSVRCIHDYEFPTYANTENIKICHDSVYFGYDKEGQFQEKFTTSDGYDSISTINIEYFPYQQPEVMVIQDTLSTFSNYTNYQWYFEDRLIEGSDSERLVVNESGKYHVVVVDEFGCKTTSKELQVYTTSIKDLTENLKYKIIPNPNNGLFTIEINSKPQDFVKLLLFNTIGEVIEEKKFTNVSGFFITEFDIRGLNSGIYYIFICTPDNRNVEKIQVY
ncbi:MAG: hypothetical protein JXR31_00470 [Prolixibacteraceae bacterium]|nr:hypothetical protein [Prolixibacteraceae bacterium]